MIPALVVTSWADGGYDHYGKRWLRGFGDHWGSPWDITLRLTEDSTIIKDPAVRAFRKREADHQTTLPDDPRWSALKWSWKVFALTQEPMPTSGWMVWIDGDVEFIKTPTQAFFDTVCPDDADVSFLGRPWAYSSETGFVAYRMDCPAVQLLLWEMRQTYLAGRFRKLTRLERDPKRPNRPPRIVGLWGDAAVFDHCLLLVKEAGYTLRENDMAKDLKGGDLHVWPNTVLAEFLTHHKGPKRRRAAYGPG